jgi:hypothetical protein
MPLKAIVAKRGAPRFSAQYKDFGFMVLPLEFIAGRPRRWEPLKQHIIFTKDMPLMSVKLGRREFGLYPEFTRGSGFDKHSAEEERKELSKILEDKAWKGKVSKGALREMDRLVRNPTPYGKRIRGKKILHLPDGSIIKAPGNELVKGDVYEIKDAEGNKHFLQVTGMTRDRKFLKVRNALAEGMFEKWLSKGLIPATTEALEELKRAEGHK